MFQLSQVEDANIQLSVELEGAKRHSRTWVFFFLEGGVKRDFSKHFSVESEMKLKKGELDHCKQWRKKIIYYEDYFLYI